jgi:hypothetical protein
MPSAVFFKLPTSVTAIDVLWREAHTARDDEVLDPAALTRLTPGQLTACVLYPHAAARWAWFDECPAYSIWAHHRAGAHDSSETWEPAWRAEGALLTRPHGAVLWCALEQGAHAFLEACAAGGTVAEAAGAALRAQADTDIQAVMAMLLHAGVFCRLSITRIRDAEKTIKIKHLLFPRWMAW